MKKILLLIMILVLQLSANDPRERAHGISVIEYNYDNEFKYMATWSSVKNSNAEDYTHDIFRENFHFDSGEFYSDSDRKNLVDAKEAQEPVQTTVIPGTKIFISVWEEGRYNNDEDCPEYDPDNGRDCVEIHARIYNTDYPNEVNDGFVVDSFWGNGEDDVAVTHAPTVSYIKASNDKELFVIAYAEEPRGGKPRIKVRVYDKYGNRISLRAGKNVTVEGSSIYLTNSGKDKWWPVSASDNDKHTFIAWQYEKEGRDYVNVQGCVLNADYSGSGKYKINCQDRKTSGSTSSAYIYRAEQYHYSVAWLNDMEKFILIAKSNNTASSKVSLISRDGYRDTHKTINNYPIIREAQIAIKSEENENNYSVYKVVYPSNDKDITVLKIKDGPSGPSINTSSVWHENNTHYTWSTTGVASLFVKDNDGQDSWGVNGEEDKLIFSFPDKNGQLVKLPIAIDKF